MPTPERPSLRIWSNGTADPSVIRALSELVEVAKGNILRRQSTRVARFLGLRGRIVYLQIIDLKHMGAEHMGAEHMDAEPR
jgi:hypothetical protein